MEFCPKCGSVIVQKRTKERCIRCGYYFKGKVKLKTTETIGDEAKQQIAILKKEDMDVLPIISIPCKKCGHNKAQFWTVQTRSGDEAETKFFRCVKCQYTWREYR